MTDEVNEAKGEIHILPKVNISEEVQKAIAHLMEERKFKSFSQRHPELGKMIKCQICLRRHRSSQVCRQMFSVGTHDTRPLLEKTVLICQTNTRKGMHGAKAFEKKRRNPHHSHRLLLLVQMTQKLFPKYYPKQIDDPAKAMHAARGEAIKILTRLKQADRKRVSR